MEKNINRFLLSCISSIPEGKYSLHFDLYTIVSGYGLECLDEPFGQELTKGISIPTKINWEQFLDEFANQLALLRTFALAKGIKTISYGFIDGDLYYLNV